MKPTRNEHPFWSSPWLIMLITWYDAIARPSLSGLAIISSATAVVGYASSFENPDFAVYLRCAALGFGLWLIARTFWAGAWLLPALETKRPLQVFAVVGTLGFAAFAIPSTLGSLFANGGGVSVSVTQQENVDHIDNARQDFALYIGELPLAQVGLEDRATQARAFQTDEIAGRGPTGIGGVGSVSNSFGASAAIYDQAADILAAATTRASVHIEALDGIMGALRAAQIDPDLTGPEKDAQLKLLSGRAIAEMRALLALDPARALRTAASKIAVGVPQRSNARPSSQARITEISAGMRSHAAQLMAEADRIAALAPDLPQQVTQSPAERILETMWRMPGLTMAALLFDLSGWVAVFFRLALYMALKAKLAEEGRKPGSPFIYLDEMDRAAEFMKHVEEMRARMADDKPAPKRGRPKGSTNARPKSGDTDKDGGGSDA
ncbi:MAG: hypothetical protein AAFQ58_23490 [Pseudomonadota bacterium]